MKVLWICNFSNPQVRASLHFSNHRIENILRCLINKQKKRHFDHAAWITNGIKEFEKFKEVELHVISPHYGMKYNTEEFKLDGIYYHFFRPDDNSFFKRAVKKIFKQNYRKYKGNRKIVKKLTNEINPDIIHLFGAENPHYSITTLDIEPSKIPFLVSLQTLMSNPEFITKYPISVAQYQYRVGIEHKILKMTNYIGSIVPKSRQLVWEKINPNAILINTSLAVAENVVSYEVKKLFDFVYFANSIDKAVDVAIETFAIVCKKYPSLTLNIIGGSKPSFSKQLEVRINKLGIEKNIIFSGKLPTHVDVLKQVQKSKYALLPLKIDHISGTVREAMFSGIPVVTTRTHGTPSLNKKRQSVLISEQEDYQAMAQNMIKLIESPKLVEKLKENGLITVNERWNNNKIMKDQVKAYQAIYDHHHFNKPIPSEIGKFNPKLNEIG